MYLAGLTAREISILCKRCSGTIHYHMQRREYYEPGFQAAHEAALDERRAKNASPTWRQKLKEVAEFHAAYGRSPRSTGSSAERSLQVWLTEQRNLFESEQLSPTKIRLLQVIPDWHVDPRQKELDDLWKAKFSAVCEYFLANGCFPRYRAPTTADEKTLGIWLHNQHQRRSKGTLAVWRLNALDHALPGWHRRS